MKIAGREVVPVAHAEAWRRILDPEVLKRCTPGLETLDERQPGRFDAVLELHLPAIQGRFTGSVEYLEQVAPERLRMRVQGKGPPGFIDGEATLVLAPEGEGTAFAYTADVQVGGQIGRLGQRMISGVAKEMAGQFFEAFAAQADAAGHGAPAPPAKSPIAAFLQLVWRTILNLLGLSRRS